MCNLPHNRIFHRKEGFIAPHSHILLMNGRTLTRIVIAAAAIGIGMGLLLQLVLSFPASGRIVIPAAVILAVLAAASQWDWVKDEVCSSENSPTAPPSMSSEKSSGDQDGKNKS